MTNPQEIQTGVVPARASVFFDAQTRHRIRLGLAIVLSACLLVAVALYGFDYYGLPLMLRVRSVKHALLRPSGVLGLRLGMLGLAMFFCLYAYALRKRWPWLGRIGKTRNWLDFHVVAGIAAPLLITLHAAFKFRGLAGVAYWIMIAVALSGIVGRYLYSLIPRGRTAAELSLKEIESLGAGISDQLASQRIFPPEDLARLNRFPDPGQVSTMPLWEVLVAMLKLDLQRPLHIAALRRKVLSPGEAAIRLGGLLPSGNHEVEQVIGLARRQAWIVAKIIFFDRAHEVFHLWHVVHRPFSYSLAVLMVVHIVVVVLLGYY